MTARTEIHDSMVVGWQRFVPLEQLVTHIFDELGMFIDQIVHFTWITRDVVQLGIAPIWVHHQLPSSFTHPQHWTLVQDMSVGR